MPLPPFMSSREPDWTKVASRSDNFPSNIALTKALFEDGKTKNEGVRFALNSSYWGSPSKTANSMLIGSWGQQTRVAPPRDVDVLFQLPYSVYQRFEQRTGNRQSQLLQEVKRVLQRTYPKTDMRGHGQVVIVPFESYGVEVVPAFLLHGGAYWLCDTNDGGQYKKVDPIAEQNEIGTIDSLTNGNRIESGAARHPRDPTGRCIWISERGSQAWRTHSKPPMTDLTRYRIGASLASRLSLSLGVRPVGNQLHGCVETVVGTLLPKVAP